jgi:glycosyltransferase involved in cell wall biosynthesis
MCRRLLKFKQIANVSGLGEVFEKKDLTNLLVACLYKLSLAGSKQVFFQNNEDMKIMIERHLLPGSLCKHIPGSGVDLDTYCPISSKPKVKPRVFLMYGRLVPSKGYDLFMKAAEQIHLSKNYNADFWIMGIVDKSREESQRLFERILTLQKKGIIKYLQPTDEVAAILQKVDVVVLPSKYNEGVPRSLLEAMACAKPIITTAWKGCRDTVDHGRNGYLISIDDCDSLMRYMVELIEAPGQKLVEMGKEGRRKAEAEFDEKQVINAYMQQIDEDHVFPAGDTNARRHQKELTFSDTL